MDSVVVQAHKHALHAPGHLRTRKPHVYGRGIYLDIWWRSPKTREDCIVDGRVIDQFVDAIGTQNCKMITFTTGERYLMSPEESIIYADMFVVLHKR